MKNKALPIYETVFMLIGELAVSLLTVGVYFWIDKFSIKVVSGLLLGIVIALLNFFFLTISVNRAVDKIMTERGEGEMSDEEAEEFAKAHGNKIQATVKLSYFLRTASVAAALIIAALLREYFDIIATMIPLFAHSLILTLSQLVAAKKGR